MQALLRPMAPLSAPRPPWAYLAFPAPERERPTILPSAKRGQRRGKPPSGRRVLFLDFDGVLHPGPPPLGPGGDQPTIVTKHFGWLPTLLRTLTPFPDVKVVVHSTWRLCYDESELWEILSELGGRYLGATPAGERYASILQWLEANPDVTSYRILDDEPDEFPQPLPEQLIVCDPTQGVTGLEVASALREWLSG
jgi:hypothetical protein